MEELNPNNVGGVGTQTYLASVSTIVNGVNDVAYINLITINDGSLQTETVSLLEDPRPNKFSEPEFSLPNDQLIQNALEQLQIDDNVEIGTYLIQETQYFEVPNTIKKEYIIQGTVIDFYKQKPIKGAKLLLPLPGTKFDTKTDKNGKFKIKATYPIDKDTEKVTLRPPILVTANGYIPKKITPYALDQTIREDLRTTELKSTKGLTDEAKAKIAAVGKKIIASIQALKATKMSFKVLLKKFVKIVKERLIPFLLNMLAAFLIGKLSDILSGKLSIQDAQAPCPTPEEIARLINKRNRVVRQLNQIYKILDTALKVSGILGGVATIFLVAADIIKKIPLPTSVPPGVGIPTSAILQFQDKISKFEALAELLQAISFALMGVLFVLLALLKQAIQLLKLLDFQLQRCSVDDEDLESLNFILADDVEEDTTPDTSVNGFTLQVKTDVKGGVGSLKRRFAVALNTQGVQALKGEPSFSASEKILIDELAFYIRSNNLKAN
tara:strand:- start:13844 stop:15334 length:1491 start_codon:yes stop_codon:yes gene_type:complete